MIDLNMFDVGMGKSNHEVNHFTTTIFRHANLSAAEEGGKLKNHHLQEGPEAWSCRRIFFLVLLTFWCSLRITYMETSNRHRMIPLHSIRFNKYDNTSHVKDATLFQIFWQSFAYQRPKRSVCTNAFSFWALSSKQSNLQCNLQMDTEVLTAQK